MRREPTATGMPLVFGRHLGASIWNPGDIILEMVLGTLGGTSWGMEKAGLSEARVCDAGQRPRVFGRHLGASIWSPGDIILEMVLGPSGAPSIRKSIKHL